MGRYSGAQKSVHFSFPLTGRTTLGATEQRVPQLLGCLCQNNLVGCDACTVRVRPHFIALAEQTPGASPGQLIEQAIARGLPELVLAVLQNTELDINQPCCPQRYNSGSPLLTALRASNARIVALIAAQQKFDLAQSMPEYECWDWVRTASLEVLQLFLSIPGSDVNRSDGNGKTLLAEVVYDLDSQDKLRWLLSQRGIVIDNKQVDDTTPLYRAGLVGNLSAFEFLLARGADVNNRNNDNRWTILMCAVADDRVHSRARTPMASPSTRLVPQVWLRPCGALERTREQCPSLSGVRHITR